MWQVQLNAEQMDFLRAQKEIMMKGLVDLGLSEDEAARAMRDTHQFYEEMAAESCNTARSHSRVQPADAEILDDGAWTLAPVLAVAIAARETHKAELHEGNMSQSQRSGTLDRPMSAPGRRSETTAESLPVLRRVLSTEPVLRRVLSTEEVVQENHLGHRGDAPFCRARAQRHWGIARTAFGNKLLTRVTGAVQDEFYCHLCQENHLKEGSVLLGCGHHACSEMLKGWLTTRIGEGQVFMQLDLPPQHR